MMNILKRKICQSFLSQYLLKKRIFKGYLKVYGQDYSGNVSEMVKSKGAISESLQLHKETSNITNENAAGFLRIKRRI